MHPDSAPTLTSTYHPGNQLAGILRSRLLAAQTLLSAAKPSGSGIHAARQELKRARATLRLLRESIAPDDFRLEDASLRQAAQQLNEVRDSQVRCRVFSRLLGSVKSQLPQAKLQPLRKLLLRERRSATSNTFRKPLAAARTLLMQSAERTRDWRVANDLDLLTRAMQRTHRKGRDCYRAARESHSDEQLHAWRRQVKYSAYQLEAAGSLVPARMTKRLRRCARLAKLLGRDHDLVLLHERIPDVQLDAASALHLANAIGRDRAKLQRRALKLGARLYRIKPRKYRPLN